MTGAFEVAYDPLHSVSRSETDGSWLRLIGMELPQLTVVTGTPSSAVVSVMPGLLMESVEPLTRLIDPFCTVSVALPTPSTFSATLQVPLGTLIVGGDKLAENAAPWQVPVRLDKPWLTVSVAVP